MAFTSIFGDQLNRLLRKSNWTADGLSQELFAMFQAIDDNLTNNGTTSSTSGGGNVPSDITLSATPASGALPSAFPFVAFGIVTGQLTPNVYNCDLYLADPSSAPAFVNMPVTQFQIDSGEVIPNGSGTMVLVFCEKTNGGSNLVITSAIMQFPIYLQVP